MIWFIIEIVLIFLAVIYLSSDVNQRGYGQKIFWMWAIGMALALFVLGILGLLVVLLIYFVWSRFLGVKP